MAKKKTERAADPSAELEKKIEAARLVLAKHRDKPSNDPKRRLAHKKLKRGQRQLRRRQLVATKAAKPTETAS